MPLYRRIIWGGLATFHMLDTRQFRGDQPYGDHYDSDCPLRTDPTRSLMGPAQEAWLRNGFAHSGARWVLLGQQVMFSQVDLTPGPGRGFNPDAWDGCRDRVADSWVAAKVRNPVVLSGVVPNHWAADVKTRFDDPAAPVVGSELVVTSLASGGAGSELTTREWRVVSGDHSPLTGCEQARPGPAASSSSGYRASNGPDRRLLARAKPTSHSQVASAGWAAHRVSIGAAGAVIVAPGAQHVEPRRAVQPERWLVVGAHLEEHCGVQLVGLLQQTVQ